MNVGQKVVWHNIHLKRRRYDHNDWDTSPEELRTSTPLELSREL
jgi:hypothetical protein